MHEFYGAPIEAATACGAMLLVVTFLCIIPTGLIYARVEHVSLKKVARRARRRGCVLKRTWGKCAGQAHCAGRPCDLLR